MQHFSAEDIPVLASNVRGKKLRSFERRHMCILGISLRREEEEEEERYYMATTTGALDTRTLFCDMAPQGPFVMGIAFGVYTSSCLKDGKGMGWHGTKGKGALGGAGKNRWCLRR